VCFQRVTSRRYPNLLTPLSSITLQWNSHLSTRNTPTELTSENTEHFCGTHHIRAYPALQQNSQTLRQHTCTRCTTQTQFPVSEHVQSLRTPAVDECIQTVPVHYFKTVLILESQQILEMAATCM